MTLSNEPGYYEDGQYGVRIENIVLVKDVKLANNFGNKGYLGFESVTMYVYFRKNKFPSVIGLFLIPCSGVPYTRN
jgi:Xaa-Pro aminopeptidase